MKKSKLIPSILLLVLCIAVLGVGIYAAIPTSTSIEGTLTIIAPARELDISGTVTGAKESITLETDSVHDVTSWDLSTLSFDLSDKTSLEEVEDIQIKVHIKNKSVFEYGAYFYKEGAELDAKGNATINSFEDLNTSIVNSDSVKLADVTLTDYTHIMPNDDTKTNTTLDEIDMTITLSLADFFVEAPKSSSFKYILKIEQYQANYDTDSAYSGSDAFVKVSSKTGATSASAVKTLGATPLASKTTRTQIPASAFANNTLVKKVVIPGTVTSIGNSAFSGCTALESILQTGTITTFGTNIFTGCNNLSFKNVFSYKGGKLTIADGITEIKRGNNPWDSFKTTATELFIPKSVTRVEGGTVIDYNPDTNEGGYVEYDGAFCRWDALKNVTIEEGSSCTIEGGSFRDCNSLEEIWIPENVKLFYSSYEDGAGGIYNCSAFANSENLVVYFEGNRPDEFAWREVDSQVMRVMVRELDEYYSNKGLSLPNHISSNTSYLYPENEEILKSLNVGTWLDYMENISYEEYFSGENPGNGYSWNFKTNTLTLTSPTITYTTHVWDKYKTIAKNLVIEKSVTSIEGMGELKIGDMPGQYSLRYGVFSNWDTLENVIIKNGSTLNLEPGVFFGCESLKSVYIPNGVELSHYVGLHHATSALATGVFGPFVLANKDMKVYFEGARDPHWGWRVLARNKVDTLSRTVNTIFGEENSTLGYTGGSYDYIVSGIIDAGVENYLSMHLASLSTVDMGDRGALIDYEENVSYEEYLNIIQNCPNSQDMELIQQIESALIQKCITSASSVQNMMKALEEAGYTYQNMQTSVVSTYLYWVKETNSIIYTNEKDEILYSTTTGTFDPNAQTWVTLTGEIPEEQYTGMCGGIFDYALVSISNAKQLNKLAKDIHDSLRNSPFGDAVIIGGLNGVVQNIALTSNINMRGADISFGNMGKHGKWTADGGANITPPENPQFTINGNGYKLYNLYSVRAENENPNATDIYEKRGSGLINTNYGTATFKNLEISDSTFGALDITQSGILVAYNLAATDGGRGTLVVEDVKINNCVVYGDCKVGTLIGQSASGSLIIKGNTTIRNTKVISSAGEAGGVFGYFAESYKFLRADYTDTSLPSQLNNLGTKFTVDSPEILIDNTVTVEIAENPYLPDEAKAFVRVVNPSSNTVTIDADTVFGTQAGLCTNNDIFTMKTPTNGYITAWELLDGAPKWKGNNLIVRGTTAKYGFVASARYSAAYILQADGSNFTVEYNGQSYTTGLAYAECPIDDLADVGKLWCDMFPNSTVATTSWFI